jgi:hypothetical protein
MTTARQIIRRALLENGALTLSEAPTSSEAQDGLSTLNAMLGSWSNDSLLTVARSWETFPTIANQSTYTIGAGQDFDTVRPIQIVAAYVRQGNVDYPLMMITDQAYNDQIGIKNIQGISEFLSYDNGFPFGKIRLYPVPTEGYSLFLLSEKQIDSIPSLDTDFEFPPGWEEAVIYNLAMRLANQYGQQPTQLLMKMSDDSLGRIKRAIAKNRDLDARPSGLGRRGNIYNGWSL